MKISTVISNLKQSDRKTIALFFLFSVIFHIFLVYWFYTVKFTIRDVKPKKTIIEIRPLTQEKTLFPAYPKSYPKKQGASKSSTSGKTAPAPTASLPGLQPTGEIPHGRYGSGSQIPGTITALKPGDMAGSERKALSAPFNPTQYLKAENLAEIFRRIEQEEIRPTVPLPSTPTGATVLGGGASGVDSNIVIDAEGQAYFDSKGFDLTPWARKVTARILENWFIPVELMPGSEADGVVGIAAVIKKNGTVTTEKIQRPSDMQLLDQAALNAFNLSSPFPSLPSAYMNETLDAYFLFNYQFPVSRSRQSGAKESPLLKVRKDSLISSLGLVKGDLFAGSVLPKFLVLGIEVKRNAYYRLMSEDRLLTAGLLQEGVNFIEIPASGFFQAPGSHNYSLDLKTSDNAQKGDAGNVIDVVNAVNTANTANTADGVEKQAFSLDILCNSSANSGQVREEVRKTGYGLALFVQNRLVAFHKKSVQYRSLLPQDRSRKERQLDFMGRRPDNPLQFMGEQRPQAVMPIIPMAALAYKYLLKPALAKKTEEAAKTKIDVFDRLSGTFLIKDSEGIEKPLDVVVMFQLK